MAKVIFRAGKVVLAVIIPLVILGIIMFGTDVFSVAEAELQGVDSNIPLELQQMQDAAKMHIEEKQYDLAQQSYYDIITAFPGTEYAMDALAGVIKCQIAQKDFEQAEATVEKFLTDYSDHPKIVEGVCDIAERYRKKKDDKAIELYQYILSEHPSHSLAVRAQSNLVRCYIKKKDKETAQAEVEKLLADYFGHPEFVEVLANLAGFCRKKRANRIAIGLYQHILTNYPSHNWAIQAQAGLAKYYIQRKDHAKTQAAIEKLLTDYSDHPDIVEVISGLANHCSTKNVDISIELYKHIASEYPSYKSPMWVQPRLIKNYIDQKDYTNARAAIEKLLTDYSDHPDIVEVIGGIADDCRKKKADDIAIELYQYIISEHPSHDLAIRSQSDLAKCYIQENDDAKAQAAIDKLLADYSDHPDIAQVIWYLAGSCRTKNVDKAIELYRYIIDTYPSHDLAIRTHSDLAKCHIQKNDYAMALQYIDRATQDYPDHMQVAGLLKAKADCYFNMNAESQVEEVVDEIFQSRLTNGSIYGILRGIAISYRECGNYERSLNLCQRVLDNDPGNWERFRAYTGIAKSYIGLDDDPNVNETLDIICADFADHEKLARAIFVIGEDYYCQAKEMKKQGHDEAAKESFLKAKNVWERVEVEVESPDKHIAAARIFFLGITTHYGGDTSKAIEYLQRLVKDYPTCNYVSSARYHIQQYAKVIRKNPARADEADELIETNLKDFVEKHPDDPQFQDCLKKLGVFYLRKAQHAKALDCFEQLIEKNDKSLGRVVNMMSICYEKLGFPETAEEIRATYQQSLNI